MFIGSCAGNFYALNKTTGEVQWSYDIRKDGKQQSFHGDPLVINDLILIGTDRSCDPEGVGHVYAFERGSGTAAVRRRVAFNETRKSFSQQQCVASSEPSLCSLSSSVSINETYAMVRAMEDKLRQPSRRSAKQEMNLKKRGTQ